MCDANAINTYFDSLDLTKQLALLKELSLTLKKKYGESKKVNLKGVCDEKAIKRYFLTLSLDDQLELLSRLVDRARFANNNNNNVEPTNNEIQAAYNELFPAVAAPKTTAQMLAELDELEGGKSRRRHGRSRKMNRRRRGNRRDTRRR